MKADANQALMPAFWQALLAPPGTPAPAGLEAVWQQPGFAVYRNTSLKACVDALAAQFPSVVRLLGDDCFQALAAEHTRASPPRDGRLLAYGEGCADHLAAWPLVANWPYLPAVARLDWLWAEAHSAADAPALAPDALAKLEANDLGRLCLRPHPAARWLADTHWPVHHLWRAAREGWEDPQPPAWVGEAVLLTRPMGAVLPAPLGPGACVLLEHCRAGHTIADTVSAALDTEPALDLGACLGQLLRQGAFTELAPSVS
jgi:hypothetical protein